MKHINGAKEPETIMLAKAIKEKIEASGLSAAKFFRLVGDVGAHAHYSYMINGKRGLTFFRAVRIANACKIDLGQIQRHFK